MDIKELKRLQKKYQDSGMECINKALAIIEVGAVATMEEGDNIAQALDAFLISLDDKDSKYPEYPDILHVRKKLNLSGQNDYASGEFRSNIAKEGDRRAKEYETEFYYFLVSKMPEMRVHEHRIIRPGNISSDFFVYTSEEDGIVIDLFYAKDLSNAGKIINIKYKRYISVPFLTYFIIMGNASIHQQEIDKKIKNRKSKLPSHIKILTEKTFRDNFKNLVQIVE